MGTENTEGTPLRIGNDGPIRTVTLSSPKRKNALSAAMIGALVTALDEAAEDSAVRVLVLTGEGDTFCAGADLSKAIAPTSADAPPSGDFVDLLGRLAAYEKPTIAKVRGVAYGGGLGLVASCHFALGGTSASLGVPEIRRGFFPMMIMAPLLRVMPRRALLDMVLLGEPIPAERAVTHGLLTAVHPDEELDAAVSDLGMRLAAQSPTALAHGLRAIHRHGPKPLEEALPALRQALYELLDTDDAREGLRAFLEKRDPVWGRH
ncbi:MAG: enoyl-CoA hydratase/isomerase family protein [Myxococcales bacterium]|nr:enoyl-CoA hydratase/isomerase family protein [Myxococcales bacterium]